MSLKAKEVAEILGISQATLSLVVNQKPGISDATRQKVLSDLKEKGFEYLLEKKGKKRTVDQNAQNGNNSQMMTEQHQDNTIAFVIYQIKGELLGFNSFFPMIMNGIEKTARQEGYNISFINIQKEQIDEGIDYIKASRCCGYVIFATEMQEEDILPFKEIGLPFVLLDNNFNDDINIVKVNNEQGTYIAVKYLREMGHEKIGYLKSGVPIRSFQERCSMALKAMKELGCISPEKYVFEVGYPIDGAYVKMKDLLRKNKELPTAFMVDNDLVAAGAMKACKEAGLRVPEDISFIGFDDRPICSITEPEMTTVQLPREYFGAEAVNLLIRVIRGETELSVKTEINLKLIKRDSVLKIN
ncbi:MAG: LacI family DNA-binding transcriptional regulator [Eubacteriales bacterium]|nr:LacI family DNA-binding transcriptional regulator [Eubacteriales bacterium]